MKKEVVKQLNELNRKFYEEVAHEFDISRQYAWPGWEKVLSYYGTKNFDVLDIGCGNGRFYKYLLTNGFKGDYVGIDSSKFLLKEAKIRFPSGIWQQRDIIEESLGTQCKFDLVVAFGVFHHIPGVDAAVELLKKMKERCSPNGLIVISFWQFVKSEKLISRTKPLSSIGIDSEDYSKNDYLLDWKFTEDSTALRYCHNFDRAEIEKLSKNAGVEIVDIFERDGGNKEMNIYLVAKPAK